MKKELITHKDPKSPISEIFRTLRTNIQFINTNKIKTLLVTSTLPGEGKSWVASNLAVIFAQTGKKVVLIDADMRKGRQYEIFETTQMPGLSNYLSQVGIKKKKDIADEVIDSLRKTKVPNLFLMPAGNIPPNPSELLVSPNMKKLLEKFKSVFDIVIIDGTPCELVTDAVILSRIVDSTIIVTAHKLTKKATLEKVIKNIRNVGGNLTGVVINKMPISSKKYEEKYYYYGEAKDFNNKKEKNDNSEIKETIKKEETKTTKNTKITDAQTTDTQPRKTTTRAKTTRKKLDKDEIAAKRRTDDILAQMNKYMDKENIKKGEKDD